MYMQNLHTHTTFCDGADTAEEMIVAAIHKGFDSIGFSGHSYASYSKYWGDKDRAEEYKKPYQNLKRNTRTK